MYLESDSDSEIEINDYYDSKIIEVGYNSYYIKEDTTQNEKLIPCDLGGVLCNVRNVVNKEIKVEDCFTVFSTIDEYCTSSPDYEYDYARNEYYDDDYYNSKYRNVTTQLYCNTCGEYILFPVNEVIKVD